MIGLRWRGITLSVVLALALAWLSWLVWPQQSVGLIGGAIATGAAGLVSVPLLRWLKTGQVMRPEGPQNHLSKAGTPTMGGIYFIPVGLAVAAWLQPTPSVLAVVAVTLAYGFVGWLDDWQVIRKQSNAGITPRQKLLGQIAIAIGACLWMHSSMSTTVALPWLPDLSLGWLFWPLALFVLVGTSNAVNLTDGLDGLAGGTSAIVFVGLAGVIAAAQPDLAGLCLVLAGACLGFLAHNRFPARVFMGDTGSLALGGALGMISLLSNSLWALALLGGVYVLESLSVLLQVSYFKYTKKKTGTGQRLLRMSPLHHHLELGGWHETTVVLVLYLAALGFVALGWWLQTLL